MSRLVFAFMSKELPGCRTILLTSRASLQLKEQTTGHFVRKISPFGMQGSAAPTPVACTDDQSSRRPPCAAPSALPQSPNRILSPTDRRRPVVFPLQTAQQNTMKRALGAKPPCSSSWHRKHQSNEQLKARTKVLPRTVRESRQY